MTDLTNVNGPVDGPIYLAGPVTGMPNYNAEAFAKAESFLVSTFPGVVVMNPLSNHAFADPVEKSYGFFFKEGLKLMLMCQTVMFLEGWDLSKGAKAEFIVAERCEMPRYLLTKSGDNEYMWAETTASLQP